MVHLYNLTLLPPSSITQAVIGNFSGTRTQEICVVRGSQRIELLTLDKETGKVNSLLATEVFGTVRSIQPFRLTGSSKGVFVIVSMWISLVPDAFSPRLLNYRLGFWQNRRVRV